MDRPEAKELMKIIKEGKWVVDLFEDHMKRLTTLDDFDTTDDAGELIQVPIVEKLTKDQSMY